VAVFTECERVEVCGLMYRITALRGDDGLWGVGYDLT